ncbi:hypothetical protein AAG570_005397 [Ranatra chinensis]|uniref:Aquaporin n=1 Tax=Ranatra chinensis TaxID=642074 RepID=A0ABD0YD01_9HEMI
MLGTATFMILGCSNVVAHLAGSEPTHLNTVISFSFGISTAIMMVGHISGAIMNPGLNFAAVILGHMSLQKQLLYTICQVLGATIGAGFVKIVTPNLPSGFCVPQVNPEVGLGAAIVVEFVTTCVLAFVFCSVLDKRNAPDAPFIFLKFGMAITALAIPMAKYSGCSMNPARAFGPAFVGQFWDNHWVTYLQFYNLPPLHIYMTCFLCPPFGCRWSARCSASKTWQG